MGGTKLNWERARKEDAVRDRGADRISHREEMPAQPLPAESDSFNQHLELKAETRVFLKDARQRLGCATDAEFLKLKAQLERLVTRMDGDQRMKQEALRLEARELAEDVREYLRWRSKRPERKDLLRLYCDSVAYIDGAGADFPRVKSCAHAVETLAYLHRWKHAFPSLPLTPYQIERAFDYIKSFATVRTLAVRHI